MFASKFFSRILPGAIVVLGLTLTSVPALHAAKDEVTTFTGIVRKAEIDGRGQVRQVYLDGTDGDVLVSRRDKGKQLLTQIGATVQATGYVRQAWNHDEFSQVLDVTEFAVVPDSATPSSSQ